MGPINAPTVFNAVFNIAQFWDGRAATLQDQAGGPPLNPIEMASTSWEQIIDKLNQDQAFKQDFLKVYPQGFSGKISPMPSPSLKNADYAELRV